MALLRSVLADNPVGYWPVDEAASTTDVKDASGNASTGTWASGTRASGSFLSTPCGTMNGEDSIRTLLLSVLDLFSVDVTFEMFVRTSSATATIMTPYMVRNDNGLNTGTLGGLLLSNGLAGRVQTYDGNSVPISLDAGINDGVWHHIVGTLPVAASATHRLYIDGVERASASFSRQLVATNTRRMVIGSNWNGGAIQFFTGDIAHVALYSGILSAARVKLHSDEGHRSGVSV